MTSLANVKKKTVQFYRNFREFTGGHLKHWHYFNHTYYSANHLPYIYFGSSTVWTVRNPWRHLRQCFKSQCSVPDQPLQSPDVLFVEGVSDWPVVQKTYPNLQRIPIINLVQHVRHADPKDPRYEFLRQRAIRLCVSSEVKIALAKTKRANGQLITIPCGMDMTALPAPLAQKPTDICIAALKNPALGQRLQRQLKQTGHQVDLLWGRVSRSHFLSKINQAKISIFLPWQTEGFYLPALEGMALNTLVICPDCIGNREFCRDGENCINPIYEENAILAAVNKALQMNAIELQAMQRKGQATVRQHSLCTERKAFLEILENLEQIW